MKAIVHIGTEKTGTSSIQSYLYLNRKKLKKAGFHFLQSGGKWNNWMVPAFCSKDEAAFKELFREEGIRTPEDKLRFKQEFIKDFEKEIQSVPAKIHTIIISSEHFHSRIRTEAEMENVHNLLTPFFDEIQIICYLREQVDMCTSHYSTHLKSGGTGSFVAFLKRCKPSNYYFNYWKMLTNWEKFFGRKALNVSLFSQDQFLNGDLLDDFTGKIDASLVGVLSKSVVIENESLRPFGQALARAINITFPLSSERPEVIDMRVRCKKPVVHRLSGKGQQPGLEARKCIYDSFTKSNERMRKKYFPKLEIVFPPPADVAQLDYVVTEDDFGTIAEVLGIMRNHGKGVMLAEEYTRFCTAIFSSIDDVTKVVSVTNDIRTEVGIKNGTEVILSEEDAVLLCKAARYFECRENASAVRLMTLASLARPSLLLPKVKLKEYRAAEGKNPKAQYMLTFHIDKAPGTPEEKEKYSRFEKWLALQNISVGNFMVGLDRTKTISTKDIFAEGRRYQFCAYTIIQAESFDAAVSLAKECPILELGGLVQVSELNFELC